MNCRTTSRLIAAAASTAMLSGCIAIVLANMDPDERAKLFLLPPDKSVIYLYRQDAIDDALPAPVVLDGEPAGETMPGTYMFWEVAPGRHVIETYGMNLKTVAFEVQPGKLYFIRQELKCGAYHAHFHLSVVDTARGKMNVRTSVLASKMPKRNDNQATGEAC